MALDKVSPAMMSPLSVSESAPSEPYVGQRWYRASTAVTYQYTNDGTSSFWLDVSSGGIGTSANRGVDIVGDIDPHKAINPSGGVGSVYYNRENNRNFVCTNATSGANVWSGRYAGVGGTITEVLVISVYYRIHTFLSNGTFHLEENTTCNILCVGGGGGAGNWGGCGGGGGAVYQRLNFSLAEGTFDVTVGAGGLSKEGSGSGNAGAGLNGSNSKLGTAHIGFGGGGGGAAGYAGLNGGCGGGRDDDGSNNTAGTGLVGINAGVTLNGDVITADHKTYSFSTTPTVGSNSNHNGAGGGGAGGANGTFASGSMTSPGHGGHGGIGKLITWATHEGSAADNTDGGGGYFGGGGHGLSSNTLATVPGGAAVTAHPNSGAGGAGDRKTNGGSGIVIIRYAV